MMANRFKVSCSICGGGPADCASEWKVDTPKFDRSHHTDALCVFDNRASLNLDPTKPFKPTTVPSTPVLPAYEQRYVTKLKQWLWR